MPRITGGIVPAPVYNQTKPSNAGKGPASCLLAEGEGNCEQFPNK